MSTTLAPASPLALPASPVPSGRRLTERRLAAVTRRYAALLRAGRLGPVHYGDPDRPGDPEARWHVRVHADDVVDVWLISWLPSQSTQLHDHGGSSGAFTVVGGVLAESVWSHAGATAGRLVERDHRAGATITFDSRRVHDVRNLGTEPAVSVHAYSRPLQRMGYYDVDGGSLHLASVLDTTDPEPSS